MKPLVLTTEQKDALGLIGVSCGDCVHMGNCLYAIEVEPCSRFEQDLSENRMTSGERQRPPKSHHAGKTAP